MDSQTTKKEDFSLGDGLKDYRERLKSKNLNRWIGMLRNNGLKYRLLFNPNAQHVYRVEAELDEKVAGGLVEANEAISYYTERVNSLQASFDDLTTVSYEVPEPAQSTVKEPYRADTQPSFDFTQTLKTADHDN